MSASRVGRAALKAGKTPISGKGLKKPIDSPGKPLPKRANPHLTNLHANPPSPTHKMSPRTLTIFGVGALGISTYCGFLYASYRREVAQSQTLSVPEDVSDRYNHTARTFDADVALSEKLMRLGAKRRDLVRRARGDVLEVSCGTGRNLEYYELGAEKAKGCRSVTFVDLSPQMVEITREKFRKLFPGFGNVAFRAEDAHAVTTGPPSPAGGAARGCYDTVVQTMGVCSMPDPVGALRHLGSITEPQRGRILLLEHGRSYYDWLNRVLDNLAPAHADRHGCWWNRDIGAIVRESGLEVVEERRWHFGTTWEYVLRPRR
ncbi:ubiquinone/menaquinone biosynthesis-related protein [Aspergillus campestris IBT 28561]|uniref:Ubiquinone/menaquinone biosynthesis-related protein n=1 Tax=Aspergillus campestris (strain IBT 28561) TaxID=1392248 RepID=A0A2I1DEB7_ASPC2|nr:ubiquinone/menaquinone biosynthesis-related protein [Aspergillus campestris IBT 28561]PKY08204.1 ubiquinone/menaquinone biosynthesis-related protein [Aspergillus campestris IBT 28561]